MDKRTGSSPRMRGTRKGGLSVVGKYRFIPAHAGNTGMLAWVLSLFAVHPRACGEHSTRSRRMDKRTGSSPRMRGTLRGRRPRAVPHRFIPAHAGNTLHFVISSCGSTVHPRACGEHDFPVWLRLWLHGSSPRMRGTPHLFQLVVLVLRFIPAHAGNTTTKKDGCTDTTVHPRACGEHAAARPPVAP